MIDDTVYIGQTTNFHERKLGHLKKARSGSTENPLYIAMRKDGVENFKFEIIDTCEERHKFIIEKYWTDYYSEITAVYNILHGSKYTRNSKVKAAYRRQQNTFDFHSNDFKQTMSTVTKGEKNGMWGKRGDNAINGRHVYMLDDNKQVVKEFVSVRAALDYLKIKGHAKLIEACREGIKYRGYYWVKEWRNFREAL